MSSEPLLPRGAVPDPSFSVFEGTERAASGSLVAVALRAKALLGRRDVKSVLVFDDATGAVVDVDFRGSPDEIRQRLAPEAARPPEAPTADHTRGPGRPRLGVVAREVTLLPRHWEWLASQPGGASVALRKLVEEARRTSEPRDRIRRSQEAAYRFMSAVAGDLPGFEEATRALFAGSRARFEETTAGWPRDVREYAMRLGAPALGGPA